MHKRIYDFPPPHLNVTMSSLEAEESLASKKTHKNKKSKITHTEDTQNKTKHTKRVNEDIYTQANTLIQMHNLTQSTTRPHI